MSESRKCRVLVVEDEAMISMLLEDMLLDLGAEAVGPAGRLDQALLLAIQADFDVGLLDINVDGRVVYPVADVLRHRNIPFIFATGYDPRDLPQRFAGCPTLTKPFSYEALAGMLRDALSLSPCTSPAPEIPWQESSASNSPLSGKRPGQ